jgi:DNA primase
VGDIVTLLFTLAPQLQAVHVRGHNYILIQCPFHGSGQERTPSCSVSTIKPVFFCHACRESGHTTWLLRNFGLSKKAAKQAIDDTGLHSPRQAAADSAAVKLRGNPFRGEFLLDNDLLDDYRQAPVSLLDAGFKMSTLRHFEVGYDPEHLRITFPLRNIYGELVGVSGRAIIDGVEPRYKIYRHELVARAGFEVPPNYTMDSVKEALLWHAHVVRPFLFSAGSEEALIITEGFKACMWIWQAGYQTPVALVGAYLSELHSELIAQATKHALLFLDNNEAGWRGTFFAAERLLAKGVKLKIANYPDNRQQPDELDTSEVETALKTAMTFAEWKDSNDGIVHEVAWKRYTRKSLR